MLKALTKPQISLSDFSEFHSILQRMRVVVRELNATRKSGATVLGKPQFIVSLNSQF